MTKQPTKQQNTELLCSLLQMGHQDRDLYRLFREAMWAFYAENFRRSDKPSNLC